MSAGGTPFYEIKIDGAKLDKDLSLQVVSFLMRDDSEKADELRLKVRNPDSIFTDHPQMQQGNEVSVTWGYREGKTASRKLLVKNVEYDNDKDPQSLTLVAHAKIVKLTGATVQKTWTGMRYWEIAAEIAKKHGLDAVVDRSEDTVDPSVVQVESDLSFLRKLAAQIDYHVEVKNDELYFGKKKFGENPIARLTYRYDKKGPVLGVKLSTKAQHKGKGRAKGFRLHGFDPMAVKALVHEATPENTDRPVQGERTYLADGAAGDTFLDKVREAGEIEWCPDDIEEKVRKRATSEMKRAERWQVEGTIEVLGDPALLPNRNIVIEGIGTKLSGTYHVSAVEHEIEGKGYSSTLEVKSNAMGKTAGPKSVPAGGTKVVAQVSVAAPERQVIDADTGAVIQPARSVTASVAAIDPRGQHQSIAAGTAPGARAPGASGGVPGFVPPDKAFQLPPPPPIPGHPGDPGGGGDPGEGGGGSGGGGGGEQPPPFDVVLTIRMDAAPGQGIDPRTFSIATEWPARHISRRFRDGIFSQANLEEAHEYFEAAVVPKLQELGPAVMWWPGKLAGNRLCWPPTVPVWTDPGAYAARHAAAPLGQIAPGSGYDREQLMFGWHDSLRLCDMIGAEPAAVTPHTLSPGQSSTFWYGQTAPPSPIVAYARAQQQDAADFGVPCRIWDVTCEAYRPGLSALYVQLVQGMHAALRGADPSAELGLVAHDGPDYEFDEYKGWMQPVHLGTIALPGLSWKRHVYRPGPGVFTGGGGYPAHVPTDHLILAATGRQQRQYMKVDPAYWGGSGTTHPTWMDEYMVQIEHPDHDHQAEVPEIPFTWMYALAFMTMTYEGLSLGMRLAPHAMTDQETGVARPNHAMIGGVGKNDNPMPGQRVDDPYLRPHGQAWRCWRDVWQGRRLTTSSFDARGNTYAVSVPGWAPLVQEHVNAMPCERDDGKVGIIGYNVHPSRAMTIGLEFVGFTPAGTGMMNLAEGDLADHNEDVDRVVRQRFPLAVTSWFTVPPLSTFGLTMDPA